MEWVETTAKTLDEAKDLALDRLGVAADDAEFEVLEEPRSGLFGRTRGEARVRARVDAGRRCGPSRSAAIEAEAKRRTVRARAARAATLRAGAVGPSGPAASVIPTGGATGRRRAVAAESAGADSEPTTATERRSETVPHHARASGPSGRNDRSNRKRASAWMPSDEHEESPVSPQEVGEAAVAFMSGLATAFGTEAATELDVDGSNLEVRRRCGSELGLMVGPGGRTLTAVQDLARVSPPSVVSATTTHGCGSTWADTARSVVKRSDSSPLPWRPR